MPTLPETITKRLPLFSHVQYRSKSVQIIKSTLEINFKSNNSGYNY